MEDDRDGCRVHHDGDCLLLDLGLAWHGFNLFDSMCPIGSEATDCRHRPIVLVSQGDTGLMWGLPRGDPLIDPGAVELPGLPVAGARDDAGTRDLPAADLVRDP